MRFTVHVIDPQPWSFLIFAFCNRSCKFDQTRHSSLADGVMVPYKVGEGGLRWGWGQYSSNTVLVLLPFKGLVLNMVWFLNNTCHARFGISLFNTYSTENSSFLNLTLIFLNSG
jgi:hypothetical protein